MTNTVTVTSPGDQTDNSGAAITPVTVTASDSSAGATLTYGDGGTLPPGLSIDPSSGVDLWHADHRRDLRGDHHRHR